MPRSGHPAVREEDVQTVNVIVLADRNAMIHELTNDADCYCTFLQGNLQAAVRRKQHSLNNPILHVNARAHAAGALTDLLNLWCWEVVYHLLILHI